MTDIINYEQKLRSIGRKGSLAWTAADRHKMLNDLLCTIHSDGGQFTSKHGYIKATDDAISIIIENKNKINSALKKAERIKALMDEDIFPYTAINELIKELENEA